MRRKKDRSNGITALYERLSRDDDNAGESNSIVHQKQMLEDYLEKQDYILFKQKEQLAAQEQKLEELTMKIEDVEALVDEVADIAYDKAVEVVADTVKLETHKEDIKLVEQSKAWVLSPERICACGLVRSCISTRPAMGPASAFVGSRTSSMCGRAIISTLPLLPA